MKIRKLVAATAAFAALAVTGLASPAEAQSGPTLADILDAQGGGTDRNWYDFDILAAGVDVAGLSDALDDPSADLTVFIPNDRAFQVLVADLYGWWYLFADEATILNKVAELEASAPGTLQTVILYHVVPGEITSDVALSVPRGTELTTLQGGTIKVFPFGRTALLVDQDRNDLDPWLVRSKLDIQASNGVAHGISLVLRPSNL
ncbi:fasciclin domain-containing protein [Actinomarinicola tropica]|uniref:Fasciclin domain-containing protein n=1 Tax=Actinomarinicola tropica TaxID=2789776 RepID=A0A5Q2RRZ6_9ACTN|nr:fasciclin domain-containing protein [Actinomarinicola tropica]QGG96670.1 fasciclin domain-containing protein [Actinomarinicola tropica]